MRDSKQAPHDKILEFIYFSKECLLADLENYIKHLPDQKSKIIPSAYIKQLENEKLIANINGKFMLTAEGQKAVESFDSYEEYKLT
jgi:winged helix-turn-helix protein